MVILCGAVCIEFIESWPYRASLRVCVVVAASLMCQLDEMLVPYPPDLITDIILILGQPELTFFANNIKNLGLNQQELHEMPTQRNLLRQQRRSGRDTLPPYAHDQC